MTADDIACTIVVPCRNEARAIGRFLDDLLAQEPGGGQREIIIADGESTDGTREILQEYCRQHPEICVIANPGRIASTGLNAAIRAARGRIILRMDVHTEYALDYVRRCLEVKEQTGAMNVGGPARTRADEWLPRAIAAAYGSAFAVGGARFHFASYSGPVDTVTYGCWLRQDLLDLGLFDENLVRNQDDELNLRIRRAGGLIWQDPSIRSWYRPRRDLRSLFRQYFQYGYWKVAVIRKHGMAASWRHLVPVTLVASLLLLAAAGVVWRPALWLLALELGAYLAFIGMGSLVVAKRRGWDLLPALPAVLACFHFAYGSGFLLGLLQFRGQGRPPMVSELTR
jgi:glycosyltransferase involved in cell wall biosynthesis